MKDISELEDKIGVDFKNKDLLKESLTHRSYLNETHDWPLPHNERLEFLGDAVLELAVTERLFEEFPNEPEGKLTVYRAALVNYQILAKIAEDLDLQDFIWMSKGERGDSAKAKEVILANAIEAVIGAIYLDLGYETAERFVKNFVLNHLNEVLASKSYRDAKSELQELSQERLKITPIYRVIEESGPAHDKKFRMGVFLGENLVGVGEGSSKQEAEVEAAKIAIKSFVK
jgi:ribonuclease-3